MVIIRRAEKTFKMPLLVVFRFELHEDRSLILRPSCEASAIHMHADINMKIWSNPVGAIHGPHFHHFVVIPCPHLNLNSRSMSILPLYMRLHTCTKWRNYDIRVPNSTSRGPWVVTTVKWRLLRLASIERQIKALKRPPNYSTWSQQLWNDDFCSILYDCDMQRPWSDKSETEHLLAVRLSLESHNGVLVRIVGFQRPARVETTCM